MYYEKELKALHRSKRFRSRTLYNSELVDFASNDYLGLAHNKELLNQTTTMLANEQIYASKSSMLVNGYHQIHKDFETALCEANHFEDAVVMGSGFNANIALIEALVRKGDILFMDELYHASGVLATNLHGIEVHFFKHNDMKQLHTLLQTHQAKRKIIAVEGIYSMDGDLCDKKVFEIANEYDALLIVDEAHSSGVVGENLMGVFDLYNIAPQPNHIKMGTLGKAYGSFGAYILASEHIITYLLNRAKPLIYATALSLYDTLFAHNSLRYILEHKKQLKQQIQKRKQIVEEELNLTSDSLILPILIKDNIKVMQLKQLLEADGYSIGAIRQPTVPHAILRVILRVGESEESLRIVCKKIKSLLETMKYKKISC